MSGVDFDASGFFKGITEHQFKMKSALLGYGKTAAAELEAHAKANRPWEDRTGNAKNSIQGSVADNGSSIDVCVSGNTEYFPYLELGNEKKNAILWPTIEELGPEILRGLTNILSK